MRPDKIIGILMIFVIISVFYNAPDDSVKNQKFELKVLYQDQITSVIKKHGETENLLLLSNNNCLYFDGESFFEYPPINKSVFRAKIVKCERIYDSDLTVWIGSMVVAFLLLVAFMNTNQMNVKI